MPSCRAWRWIMRAAGKRRRWRRWWRGSAVEFVRREGGLPLFLLVSYHGHLETARMLLKRGADVDRRNDRGQTPLGGVAFKGYRRWWRCCWSTGRTSTLTMAAG